MNPAAAAPHRTALAKLVTLAAVCAALVLVVILVQVLAGSYGMDARTAFGALFDAEVWGRPEVLFRFVLGDAAAESLGLGPAPPIETTTLIVWNVRLPRLLVGALVGVNLSVAGAIFQAITRNELASPYTLGVSAGSGLAVILILVMFPHLIVQLPLAASIGGGIAFVITYAIAWKGRGTSPVRLVLAGVIVGAVAGSLHTVLFFLAQDVTMLRDAISWTAGSLSGVGWTHVRMAAPWTLGVVVISLSAGRYLDLMLLGDGPARALGLGIERTRFLLACTAVVAAGTSISVAGHVGFVGLIIPHVVRNTVGGGHRYMVLGCMAAGPALIMAADAVARLALSPVQLPVGVITGLLGGTYFLWLMRRRRDLGRA